MGFPQAWATQIFADQGRTATYTPVTKTVSNTSGAETLTDGTPVSIAGIFFKKQTKWLFDKDGLIMGGDAYAMVQPSVKTVSKNDKFTFDGETYRVQDVIVRYGDSTNATALYQYCNLFKVA